MKRVFKVLLLFALLVFTFTSCKKANDEDTSSEAGETATEAASKDSTGSEETDSVPAAPTTVPAATVATEPTAAPETAADITAVTGSIFKDGIYVAKTVTDNEKYFAQATITIKDGKIATADWSLYDEGNNKPFDEEYYHQFEPNEEYVKQAKEDWSGSRNYAVKLLETQDVNKVDAVTGATWSFVEFEEVINLALDQATEGTAPAYKDGVYEGQTAVDVDKYYAKATVTVEGGKITKVDWNIYDSARNDLLFDQDYLTSDIDSWTRTQCNNDLRGLGGYSDKLVETQNLYQVDAVSGATWSNIKFRQAVDNALEKARTE
jgi:major membrane immunogen (membrane-anchored lipoprotein)